MTKSAKTPNYHSAAVGKNIPGATVASLAHSAPLLENAPLTPERFLPLLQKYGRKWSCHALSFRPLQRLHMAGIRALTRAGLLWPPPLPPPSVPVQGQANEPSLGAFHLGQKVSLQPRPAAELGDTSWPRRQEPYPISLCCDTYMWVCAAHNLESLQFVK